MADKLLRSQKAFYCAMCQKYGTMACPKKCSNSMAHVCKEFEVNEDFL